jgi:hypothetical protein
MNPEKIRDLTFRHHREILVEIVAEVNTIDSLLREISIPVEQFRPEIQYVFRRINAYKTEMEGLSVSIDLLDSKIQKLDRSPDIQRILQLEADLKKSATAQYINQLSRELRHLKSIHAQKISSRVSIQRALLQERLRMIRAWKSVLSDEIQILEESKKLLIDKIVALAQYTNDPAILDTIRSQIKELSDKKIPFQDTKWDASKIPVANIHVLRKTLTHHLNDVARIERVVEEKRDILKSLNKIVIELKSQIGQNSVELDFPIEPSPSIPCGPNELSEPPPVEDLGFPEYKRSRMAVRNRREK